MDVGALGQVQAIRRGHHKTHYAGVPDVHGSDIGEDAHPTVYYGSIEVIGAFHNHEPECTAFKRDVDVELMGLAGSSRGEGGMSYTQIFNYMEGYIGLTVCRDSMRCRLRYRSEHRIPRTSDAE